MLDDLDKARPTDYGAEQIFLAIDHAVTHGRPLIVTSNLPLNRIADHWPQPAGHAIASRLLGYCVQHRLAGPDRRGEARHG